MQYGGVCSQCPGFSRCKEKPTAVLPVRMICPACNEKGCPDCNGGYVDITDCPLTVIDDSTIELIRLAKLFDRGLAPVSGGVLDQAAAFLRAAEFALDEIRYWKNKKGIGDWANMM